MAREEEIDREKNLELRVYGWLAILQLLLLQGWEEEGLGELDVQVETAPQFGQRAKPISQKHAQLLTSYCL